ncbi:MAG: adenosylcobinamide-GDP ribazoletransferase [Pseudomonadota bacterium]
MRNFLIALQFMTIFRLRNDLAETPEDMAVSVGYYPLVGLVLGGCLVPIHYALRDVFPSEVLGLLLAFALAALTQGFHLDGLSDSADGLLSHRDQARKLEIMKDSRIGAFGVLALIFVVGLKTMLLAGLGQRNHWPALLLFPVWGRLAASLTACLSNYARPQGGLGRPFIDLTGRRELYLAGATALVLSVLVMGAAGLAAVVIVGLAAFLALRVWKKQLGGVTGDILGAVIELGETLGLALALALT